MKLAKLLIKIAALSFFLTFMALCALRAQDGGEHANGEPRASIGTTVPEPVGTQLTRDGDNEAPSKAITLGGSKVTAADHEMAEGYFEIGGLTLIAKHGSFSEMALRDLRFSGKAGRLIFIPDTEHRKR